MNQYTKGRLFSSLVVCLLVMATFLFSSYTTKRMGEDVWKMLGISRQAGTDEIKSSFLNGYLSYYQARNIKNIALGDRAAVAKDLLNYTKEYINGTIFKKQYAEMRMDAKPEEPVVKKLRTIEEIQKSEIAKTEKTIKESEKNMKEMSADMAKALRPMLDMLKKNLKDYQNPKHEYFASIALGEKYQQEENATRYKENMVRWEKNYPESVNAYITARLNMMLEYTKDIDYNAALVDKYGKKRFVNPAYEGKGTEWKQGFRAGKEVTEMARAFAQNWVKQLNN